MQLAGEMPKLERFSQREQYIRERGMLRNGRSLKGLKMWGEMASSSYQNVSLNKTMNYSKRNIFQLVLCEFNLRDRGSGWSKGSGRSSWEDSPCNAGGGQAGCHLAPFP